MICRNIPSSGQALPVIGLGTWTAFDVEPGAYPELKNVLAEMHKYGGRLIDSSPMYGRSESVIGALAKDMEEKQDFFYASKVWTNGRDAGIKQMESSIRKMCPFKQQIDLMQIHNLLDWKTHLPVLREWKQSGRIKYIGITHYTDAMHDSLADIITKEKIDFVQFNYSIDARHAEKRLLDIAAAHGVATLINRPFGEGSLFNKVKGRSLPAWASDLEINSWSTFFLKFIISHPAVTCVIPATSNAAHAIENFKAGSGILPDDQTRNKMATCLFG